MKKISIYILILLIGLNLLFANGVKANELSGIKQMQKILEEKKETGKVKMPGYAIGEDDGELSENQELWEAHKVIYDRLTERERTVKQYINTNSNIEIVENEINTNLNSIISNNFIYIVLFVAMLIFVYIVSIALKNRMIIFGEIFVLIVFIIMFNNISNQKTGNEISNKDKNRVIRYLNDEIQDKKLDEYANEYKKQYIDKYNNQEVDLSKVINDYIIKCYYCATRKANNKELYTSDLDVLNCFEEKRHKYDFTYEQRNVYILDWEKIDRWKVVNNILSKESMKGIYDSLTDEDIDNYNNGYFLDKLIEKIDEKIKSKEDFDAYLILPYDYYNIVRLDIKPLYKCKYWYLEKGKDLTIELPYGVTLKYDIAKLERKDINNWEDIVIKKLENDPGEEKTIFAYYIDNDDNKQGVFTTIYDDGVYNKYVLTDDIKYGSIDIYTNTRSNVIEDKSIEDKLAIAAIGYALDKTAIENRTNKIYTESYLKKIKEKGIMSEYDVDWVTDFTKEYIEDIRRINNKYLCEIRYFGNKNNDYGIFRVKWQDSKVDDIEYYIVPEDKKDLSYEEIYQLAFND